jgi:alpha-tubulin suppressor-like RCC1 family protein
VTRRVATAWLGLVALTAGGCRTFDFGPDPDPSPASACVRGGCEPGLVCVNGVCVVPRRPIAEDGGAGDAGARDGGVPGDDAGGAGDGGGPALGPACDTPFVDVAVGVFTACALTEAGAVWCWGANQCGQLGDHPESSSAAPVRIDVPPLTRLVEHVDEHGCGLDAEGRLYCWGCDYSGMRAGVTEGLDVPLDEGPFVDVATTWVGTCAVRADGTLTCFGGDYNGQLGGCAAPEADPPLCAPTDFAAPTDFTRVSLHQRHGCGISGGQVHCWGTNDVGQLGIGETSGSEPLGPTAVAGSLGAAVDLTVGINHSCALDASGGLYCWGHNDDGELGVGDFGLRSSPARVGEGWERVRAGTNHTCAIDESGGLYCWGAGRSGRLGLGDEDGRASPERVDGAATYRAVGAGGTTSCGVRSDGRVLCWGSNEDGRLGIGDADEALEALSPRPIACR